MRTCVCVFEGMCGCAYVCCLVGLCLSVCVRGIEGGETERECEGESEIAKETVLGFEEDSLQHCIF